MQPASREWGDGGGRKSEHVLIDISFSAGWCTCTCGVTIARALNPAALRQAWDVHRGLLSATVEHFEPDQLADDNEVEEFFAIHLDRRALTPGVVLRQANESEVQDEW